MNKVTFGNLRVALGVVGTTALLAIASPVHAAKPPPSGGGGTTTVATTTTVQGDWTITRLLTPQQYPAVGYDVGFVGGMAQIGQINAGAQFVWQNALGWQKQPVTNADILNGLTFAVASDGRAAMAFSAGQNGTLQYAERSLSGTWSITTVESRNVTRMYGHLDVEFDLAGNPAIAYNLGSSPTTIMLARRVGGVWQKQIVRSNGVINWLSLAFDGADPVIAHSDDINGDGGRDAVRLARLSGSTWVSEIVASDLQTPPVGQGAAYPDLSINPVTRAADVVFGDNPQVRYAEKQGSTWVSIALESPRPGFGATIDHDSSGRPHVALRRADGLWLLSREGGVRTESFIRGADASHVYDLGRPIVRIDDTDHPTVLYVKDANGSAVAGGYELELARRHF